MNGNSEAFFDRLTYSRSTYYIRKVTIPIISSGHCTNELGFLQFNNYYYNSCTMFALFFALIASSQAARKVGNGAIQEALNLGQSSNYSRDECIWKMDTDTCSRNMLKFTLYTRINNRLENLSDNEKVSCLTNSCNDGDIKESELDLNSPAWLHSSNWNPDYETVVLVHGYGGTADHLPVGILKDAYLRNGSYNVIIADWGALSKLPCYIAAVHNIKSVAKCLAELFTYLRNSGVDVEKTACVGHSLGAHVCGVTANFLTFRMHKIIGIDPAKPLIPNAAKSRLDTGDADSVQVLHTSSNYGDLKKIGHIDFYFNGGRVQPFCINATDEELCSHLRSVCYLAESIFPDFTRYGTKCKRRNVAIDEDPKGILNRVGSAHFVPIGQSTPNGAIGTYCISNIEAPFCSMEKNPIGSPYCCKPSKLSPTLPLTERSIFSKVKSLH